MSDYYHLRGAERAKARAEYERTHPEPIPKALHWWHSPKRQGESLLGTYWESSNGTYHYYATKAEEYRAYYAAHTNLSRTLSATIVAELHGEKLTLNGIPTPRDLAAGLIATHLLFALRHGRKNPLENP